MARIGPTNADEPKGQLIKVWSSSSQRVKVLTSIYTKCVNNGHTREPGEHLQPDTVGEYHAEATLKGDALH